MQTQRPGAQSLEAVEWILIVDFSDEKGNGKQMLTIGGEPYDGMQRAYGSSATSTWS
jgi:hypothetical protein